MKLSLFGADAYKGVIRMLSPLRSKLAWFTVIIPMMAIGMFGVFFSLMIMIDAMYLIIAIPISILNFLAGGKDGAHTHKRSHR